MQKAIKFAINACLLTLYGVVLAISLVIAAIARVPDSTPEAFRKEDTD